MRRKQELGGREKFAKQGGEGVVIREGKVGIPVQVYYEPKRFP